MPPTRPWTPFAPVWEWPKLSVAIKLRAREYFDEKSAILEYDGKLARNCAEDRAYCALIELMHSKGVFRSEHVQHGDVVRQLHRGELIRRNDAIGRCIVAGTWTADLRGVAGKAAREELIAAAMCD